MPSLLLKLLCNKDSDPRVYTEKHLRHPCGTNEEVIQTLATAVTGKTPNPDVTEVALCGGRNL